MQVEQLKNNFKDRLEEIRKTVHNDQFFNDIYPRLKVVLDYYKTDSLYYLFPLIERLVLEILLDDYKSDIEVSHQGTFRSLSGILEDIETRQILQEKINDDVDKLQQWFCQSNGMRNKVMKELVIIREIKKIDEVKDVCLKLLQVYAEEFKKYDDDFEIEPLA
ncbi:MAG: hypothetical protein ACOCQD_05550 [archaeon]